jgi:outer membrane protein OmpA-like peptidoglycan-associated protein
MKRILPVIVLVALLLNGCASRNETYALLPDAGGNTGMLTVKPRQGGDTLVLKQAYEAAGAEGGRVVMVEMDKKTVQDQFSAALAAQPAQMVTFTLYFLEGRDELTPESKADLSKTLSEVAKRPVPDVVVVGHTDRVGKVEDNDRLALKRAQRIKEELVAIGIPADSIQATGRGEREPLVPTADEVAEARNRRVEVLVR